MSNILIIKHGSLGDIAQASGAIQDIFENHKNDQIYLLTTKPYFDLFKKNPFVQEVILDKRLPRYNLIYLYFLMRDLKKCNFLKVFDLQNSSRTNFYKHDKYILLFPFCSPHLMIKKWPHYNKLIEKISNKYGDEFKIVTAPGPTEINDAKSINAITVLDDNKSLNISQLTALIKKSSFVIANDTGPAHITAHTGTRGLALFGKHTTAYKVSIERENFKAIEVSDLNNLSAEKVFERLTNLL